MYHRWTNRNVSFAKPYFCFSFVFNHSTIKSLTGKVHWTKTGTNPALTARAQPSSDGGIPTGNVGAPFETMAGAILVFLAFVVYLLFTFQKQKYATTKQQWATNIQSSKGKMFVRLGMKKMTLVVLMIAISIPQANSSCDYENDGYCDVPLFCDPGTDLNDCSSSCECSSSWLGDGVCDNSCNNAA